MNIWIEPHIDYFYSYMVADKKLMISQPEGIGGPAAFYLDIREEESDKRIGILNGYYFEGSRQDYIKMDSISGDVERIGAVVCGKNGRVGAKYDWVPKDSFRYRAGTPFVVVLDHFEIDKEYRNQGVGTSVMGAVPKILQNELHGLVSSIFLYASAYELLSGVKPSGPFQVIDRAYEEATERLIKLYQSVGFKRADDKVMYFKPDGRKKAALEVEYDD